MGFFDSWDGASVISKRSSHSRKSTSSHKSKRSRSSSGERSHKRGSTSSAAGILDSFLGEDGHHHHSRHSSSRAGSIFNFGNGSSRSLFGFGRSSSYYKRSPRTSFVQKTYKQLKRLLRDLVYWAKRHPMKVFMLVIMPLITGGFLTALLARFGLRLPPGIERMLGLAARTAGGDSMGLVGEAVRMASGLAGGARDVSIQRGHNGHMQWERRSARDYDYW